MDTHAPVNVRASTTVGSFRVRKIVYPPGYRQETHTHASASVTLVLTGTLRETAGSRRETAGGMSVVAKLPGTEHADEFGPSVTRTLQVAFDPAELDATTAADLRLAPWRWFHDGTAARPLIRLWKRLHTGTGRPKPDGEDLVLDTLGAVALGEHGRRGHGGPDGPVPDWLLIAREALDDVLPSRISVRRLAEIAGVHPVSLSRAFRRHFGCTITDYRRRHRLGSAATLLVDSGGDISRIAHAAGFADHPHLCRAFRGTTGLTPGEFRRISRAD